MNIKGKNCAEEVIFIPETGKIYQFDFLAVARTGLDFYYFIY